MLANAGRRADDGAMPFGPPVRQPADPGSPSSRKFAVIVAVAVSLVVIGMQNIPPLVDFFGPTQNTAEAGAESGDEQQVQPTPPVVAPPRPGDPFVTIGRLYVKMADWVREDPSAMPTLDRFATGDADRLRAAIVAGELLGDEEAAARLAALADRLDAEDPIARDAAALGVVYAPRSEPEPGAGAGSEAEAEIEASVAERLRRHHGFFADVALAHRLPADHPDRAGLLEGGFELVILSTVVVVGLGLALLTGSVLFIVGLVQALRNKMQPRFVRPEAGGSVFLEVYALFVGGFLLLKLLMDLLAGLFPGASWLMLATLLGQWSLLLVVFWPRLRGMSGERLAGTIGWHAGKGFWREVGWGILGYLAGLPVYVAGMALTILAMLLATFIRGLSVEGEPPVPAQTIFEIIGTSPPLELVLFFSLAVLWAPLCEESVFRGALYRHFRGRWSVTLAALASASLFGFMHGYGPLFVFPLIALGTVFAIMREWRGSLIAPMTAHMLHNGTVTVLLLVVIRLVG